MKSKAGIRKKRIVSDALDEHRDEIKNISETLGLLPVTAALLFNRGYCSPESARRFINIDLTAFHPPFLLCDMNTAVDRILTAVNRKEKIKIYGDYDVDGVTSVSMVYLYLKSKGADVDYYIPSRSGEGYGVSHSAIAAFAEEGVKLIITVDTGITAFSEAEFAAGLGMDMIITDHHECHSSIPKAAAVINPRRPDSDYPFKEIAGVGVAFKLICALEQTVSPDKCDCIETLCEQYADLAAIGTIADVVPLVDENRLLVSIGLQNMEHCARPGLEALMRTSVSSGERSTRVYRRKRVTASLVGFVIAPRINAAGRITSAGKAVELFLTDSPSAAEEIARELCKTNSERQEHEQKIIQEAFEIIKAQHDFEKDRVIVLAQDEWHHGIIGIVASRITEYFDLPSVLISFDGDTGKGSGRSVKGLNLVEALNACKDLLLKYGGHELAAGLSIERNMFGEFKKRINEYAACNMSDRDTVPVRIDCLLTASDLTLRQAKELRYLEPYGIANPAPAFMIEGAVITEIVSVNKNRHARIQIKTGGELFNAIFFGSDAQSLDLYPGDKADIIFNLDINEYQNTQSVQLILFDVCLSQNEYSKLMRQKTRYAEIKNGAEISCGEDVIPGRDDFSDVYLYIKSKIKQGSSIISVRDVCRNAGDGRINYVKTKFIIDIFNETGIFVSEKAGDDIYEFTLSCIGEKVNLERSSIYCRLRQRQCNDE